MDAKERGFLRIVELLNSFQNGGDQVAALWRAALVWGDGKGNAGDFQSNGLQSGSSMAVINEAAPYIHLRLDAVINAVLLQLETIKRMQSADPRAKALKAIAAEAGEGLSVSSSSWLKAEAVGDTIFAPSGNPALRIGTFPDGRPLDYSGEGSLLTIAPPGSGKTQCHVFPNLLTWPGSALILDISGDIYEHTSKWRAENVGPVYKFSPLEPATSHCYNPLTFVRSATDYIWEDSRLLAELMIVPSNTTDPFWENEARTVLTAAIAYVCYSRPPENRPMNDVVEVLFGGKPWQDMLTGLRAAVDVRVMTQHATALSTMNEKTLSSVLQTARTSLQAWTGERIARVTAKSDWSPADLCAVGPKRPTVYIYMRPNEVDTSTLSLLRVFIGQHMRIIMSVPVPPPNQRPQILVMLDELPRLRNMPPVDEALAIGRKYGLRLWMFAQSVGQLQNAYENADGMIGHCAVRLYMNPSGADGLSEKLSEEIGSIDSLHDGTRKRLVEAADLAGPGFRNQVLVLARETRPARVNKAFAYQDPELKQRMDSL